MSRPTWEQETAQQIADSLHRATANISTESGQEPPAADRRPGAHLAQKAKKEKEKKTKKEKAPGQRLRIILSAVMLVLGLYGICVFSNIPFIAKWRAIYIETAMGTMTHQWLATWFIPGPVIDEVMGTRSDLESSQKNIFTDWLMELLQGADKKLQWNKLEKDFFRLYSEIDKDSFNAYLKEHGDSCFTADGYLLIDEAGLDQDGTSIRTVHGDQVLAIDTEAGIVIVRVEGDGYVGRLAIVRDPGQVGLELSLNFGKSGSIIADIAKANDAVLAMNASGFWDPEGHGNGGTPHGLVIRDGELLSKWMGNNNKAIGFDYNDQLNIGTYTEVDDYRDAVEFKPILVLDGEKQVSGSSGWGIQPRSAIGQTKDGQVLMLVVDGRQPGYSIGCTMGDLADVLSRYDAQQACNLDGGSSSIMYYRGRKITRPSSGDKENGRLLPNAFVVTAR